jgi:hypothetical protein
MLTDILFCGVVGALSIDSSFSGFYLPAARMMASVSAVGALF